MDRANWSNWVSPDYSSPRRNSARRRVASLPSDERRHQHRSLYESVISVPRDRDGQHDNRERLSLVPLFPIAAFTPQSSCPHKTPIPDGSSLYCVVCHDTGMRHHPALKRTAADIVAERNWKPPEDGDQWSDQDLAEPTVYEGKTGPPKTRREQRAAMYAK